MKKYILTLLMSLSIGFAYSQALLTLDSYLIPENKKGITIAQVNNPNQDRIKLVKDTSKLFEVNKQGYLKLKKGKQLTSASPIRYEIVLQTAQGKKSFELVKDNFLHNKVIAHRGAWKNHDASQNSMNSLKRAIEIGCEAVEFDVWLSADNKMILSHDPTIGGKVIDDTSSAELFKIELKNNDTVPSLADYLNHIKTQNKTHLVLEVKKSPKGTERNITVADSAVRIVHQLKAQAWVEYISFDFDVMLKIRELDPSAHITYLEIDKSLHELKDAKISGIDYHFSSFINNPKLISEAHALGLTTNAWTVNDKENAELLLDAGIDFLTTDEPEVLLRLIENK